VSRAWTVIRHRSGGLRDGVDEAAMARASEMRSQGRVSAIMIEDLQNPLNDGRHHARAGRIAEDNCIGTSQPARWVNLRQHAAGPCLQTRSRSFGADVSGYSLTKYVADTRI